MKILVVGDPHGDLNKIKRMPVKNIDLILLTGDLGRANLLRKMHFEKLNRKKHGLPEIQYSQNQRKEAFMEAYDSSLKIIKYLSKFAPVFLIFGNVESSNSDTREYSRDIGLKLPFLYNALKKIKGVRVINNRLANFHSLRIGGLRYFVDASWVREFRPSNFRENLLGANKETSKVKKILNRFDKLDILLCHQPPYGVLDRVNSEYAPKDWRGKHAGSKAILDYVNKKKPKYVFCGHIHEAEGIKKVGNTEVYNLGVCGYKVLESK